MHKILIDLYIIHLWKSSTCFENYPAHLQEVYVVIVYMQPLVSLLSAGDCQVGISCLILQVLLYQMAALLLYSFILIFLYWCICLACLALQILTIPEAAYIQLRRRPPEDEQGNARNMYRILIIVLYINKLEFCASSWKSTKVALCVYKFSLLWWRTCS